MRWELSPTYQPAVAQVERLTKQYEEIAALAAAAGLQLDPLGIQEGSTGQPQQMQQQQARSQAQQAPAAAKSAASAAPAAAAAVSKAPQPKAIEVAEGDRKVRATT